MVMPGVTMRNPLLKRLLPDARTAFVVCQAISIAMTVVLPAPVAIFIARRKSSGFEAALPFSIWVRIARY
jgi:hypothetical protein